MGGDGREGKGRGGKGGKASWAFAVGRVMTNWK